MNGLIPDWLIWLNIAGWVAVMVVNAIALPAERKRNRALRELLKLKRENPNAVGYSTWWDGLEHYR